MLDLLLFLIFLGCFFINLAGMIYYSYLAVNAPNHNLLYLVLAIWSTGLSWYGSTVLMRVYDAAKKAMDETPEDK